MEKHMKNMDDYASIMSDGINAIARDHREVLFKKDHHTFSHCYRVMDLCFMIAFEMELTKESIEDLAVAAFFHDIGKVAVPDKILKKTGALTDEERLVMQRHPSVSARVVRTAGGSRESVKAIACHHEHYDGKGYLYGLHGKNIPLHSRIISIADAYDAITSHRHYAGASEKEEALQRLIAGRGSQFDPEIVDLFVERIAEPEVNIPEAI